jgi:hypothetical protein
MLEDMLVWGIMIASFVVPLVLAVLSLAAPPTRRAPAQVITECSVPGTAALTFVSSLLFLSPHRLIVLVG